MFLTPSGGSDSGRVVKTVQERWRESLLGCSSLSQVFLHLSTLERSVIWAKSLLNARCKVCRRKGDAENMLLCDSCDRGHHIHCVRPKLKVGWIMLLFTHGLQGWMTSTFVLWCLGTHKTFRYTMVSPRWSTSSDFLFFFTIFFFFFYDLKWTASAN